jgi:hypothetical protein
VILAATIDFVKTKASADLTGISAPADMQMALPVRIEKQRTARPRAHLL